MLDRISPDSYTSLSYLGVLGALAVHPPWFVLPDQLELGEHEDGPEQVFDPLAGRRLAEEFAGRVALARGRGACEGGSVESIDERVARPRMPLKDRGGAAAEQ